MRPGADNRVAVVAVGREPSESLRRMCRRHHWWCLAAGEAVEVLRTIRRNHILVAIVEVSPTGAPSIGLLRLLSSEASETTVIAVAAHHEDGIERDIREAGAHWYIPTVDEAEPIERMAANGSRTTQTIGLAAGESAPDAGYERISSSSPLLINHGRRAWMCSSPRASEGGQERSAE